MSQVQKAWDNHFTAFGGQDVDAILGDYTEESEIVLYDIRGGGETRAKGLAAIKSFFEGLFKSLSDLSDLGAPLIQVEEGHPGTVFLVWKCPASGVEVATDTFIFQGDKIVKQLVVSWKSSAAKAGGGICTNTDPTGGMVQKAWDNHFAAFGGQDVNAILKDYTEESVVTVYDVTSEEKTTAKGLIAIKSFFEGLFEELSDLSDLGAPLIQVQEDPGNVFLVWRNQASGIVSATDSFIFDKDGKIKHQNVVVERKKEK